MRDLIDDLSFAWLLDGLGDCLLDPRHVDDAFAQHGFRDLTEFDLVRTCRLRGSAAGLRRRRHDHADELLIEAVLDLDERRGHAQQGAFIRGRLLRNDGLQIAGLALHFVTQFAEPKDAERVADLLQKLELRRKLIGLRATLAYEDIECVFHTPEVFLDGSRDRLHELDRRGRQRFACLFDVIVDRQQLGQTE